MKPWLFALGILLAATTMLGTMAEAQNYPWCAQYSGDTGVAMNCGFNKMHGRRERYRRFLLPE